MKFSLLESQLRQELSLVASTVNPNINPSIRYILVLSGTNSYFQSLHNFNPDIEDDYNRVQLGLKIAKEIAALKKGCPVEALSQEDLISVGPYMIYNGSPDQNQDIITALNLGTIAYPKEKFIILSLSPDHLTTKGQFLSLKKDLPLKNTSIGIVSHGYHLPRLLRMLGKNAPLYPFGPQVEKTVYLVDRTFKAPGATQAVEKEIRNIPLYIEKGDLSLEAADDVVFLQQ